MTTQTEDKRSVISNANKKEPTAGTRGLVKKQYNKGDKSILMDDSSEINNELKLPILRVEAFRSRLETYFTLRCFVSLRGGGVVLIKKLCSHDNAKALLATEAALKQLPAIQAVVNSPVFAEDERGNLTVLNQGYHRV